MTEILIHINNLVTFVIEMREFFKILTLVRGYRKYAILNVMFNLFAILFSAFSLVMLMPIMEILFKPDPEAMAAIIANPPIYSQVSITEYANYYFSYQVYYYGEAAVLLTVCILVVSATLLKNLCTYLALYFIAIIRNGIIRDYRNELYDKLVDLPLSFYSEEKKGNIISKMTNDLKEVEWSVLRSLEAMFRDPLQIIAYFTMLVFMSGKLTLFLIIFFPVSGFLIGMIGKSLRKSASKGQSKLGDVISHLEETLGGLRIIKGFNAEHKSKSKFANLNEDYNSLMVKMYRRQDMASPVSEFLGVTLIASVLWFGGQLVFSGEILGSFFIVYIATLSQLISPFKSITTAYSNAQRGLAALDRVKEITEADIDIKDAENAITIGTFSSEVCYKNLSFKYENEYVLKNVNLTIKKGETVALVGQSGSGKSTLADLLPRFYEVEEGALTIDGVNIKDMTTHSLRAQLGIVTQQSILFNDTIYNNIAFGVEDTSIDKVMEAAKIANAHEFIKDLENGYETNIGDSGGKLSGGQRQRISIARAVLKNPPIMILDEATSALDTESEKLVQDALNNLMKNRTSLVIAHRLSTIQHADKIIVMQHGEIIEQGTHQELIHKQGTYYKLTQMQSFS